jgi:hypothetical protein
MRYEVRWSNGYWKAFDTITYREVALFYLKKDAVESTNSANRNTK